MKYYAREITRREAVNRFNKQGYNLYLEYIKTNDITAFNKNRRVLFQETQNKEIIKKLRKLKKDIIYSDFVKTLSRTY